MSVQESTIEREAPARSPVTAPWSSQFDMASQISGRTYRTFVFEPPLPAPEAGYPLLVVLDGNMTFPIAATMAAMYAFSACPALVVLPTVWANSKSAAIRCPAAATLYLARDCAYLGTAITPSVAIIARTIVHSTRVKAPRTTISCRKRKPPDVCCQTRAVCQFKGRRFAPALF